MSMVQALVFLLILSVVVLIHELGHFVVARVFGVRVDEFGFGYPPRAMTVWKRKGTEYTINWLPLGGFVRLYGENGEKEAGVSDSQAFWSKALWQRAVILLAGVVMNFILGVVLFAVVYTVIGVPADIEGVRVSNIASGSPAAEVLEEGDVVERVIVGGSEIEVNRVTEFIEVIGDNLGEEVSFELRGGEKVVIVPRVDPPEGEGALGVVITDTELRHYPIWQMPFRGVWVGLQEAVAWGREILRGLGSLVSNLFSGRVPEDIAGPVGIYQISNEVRKAGILPLLQFVGVLSINLAILNVLPFPALDGGRLVFLVLELIRGRRIREEIEGWVNMAGMILLLGLMVVVTLNDVLRLLGR